MTTATDTLRIHRLSVSNYMRVQALTIDAQGNHITISGPNGSGKTSAVDAIFACLAGHSTKERPEPIHQGADAGEIEIDLGEFTVTRRFTPSGSSLKITPRDGSKVREPQKLLNSLFSTYSLDPVAFLQQRPQDQVDAILAVAGVRPPVDQVKELTGEAHATLPGESADKYLQRLSADETGIYYVRRREQNRTVISKRKAADEAVTALEAIGGRPTEMERPASTEGLLKELEAVESTRKAHREARDGVRTLGERIAKVEQFLADCQSRITAADNDIKAIDEQIAQLQARRATRMNDAVVHEKNADGATLDLATLRSQQTQAQQALAVLVDPDVRATEIRKALTDADRRSKALAERNQAATFVDQMAADHVQALEYHNRLDQILAALRHLRLHLLDGVDLGISGLSIGDGEVKLNGVSIRQASHAEKLRLACAVAMKQSPRLKLLRVDDGEHLDQDSMTLLKQLANQQGWQVVITRVADVDELTVVIEDAA